MFKLFKVTGNSMFPEFKDGDFVLIVTIPVFLRRFREGNLVVFQHPLYGQFIKRVSKIDVQRQRLFVTGTHDESLDSQQLGWIDYKAIIGKVVRHIPRRN